MNATVCDRGGGKGNGAFLLLGNRPPKNFSSVLKSRVRTDGKTDRETNRQSGQTDELENGQRDI